MEHESQVIWISGKPGSGKSTLAKHLIDSVVTQNIGHQLRKQGTAVTASFFFNGRGSEIERSERGFLQSLLHQFVTQIPELTSLVPKQKRDNTGKTVPTSLEQLRKSLLSILGDSRVKSTRLVIDAVDECEEDCKETIVYFITEDLVKHPSIPQVLVTSRLDLDLQDPFGAYPTIKMEDLNSDDIKTYLGAEFGSLASRDPRPELIVGIVERAILRSQGVFLWVKLVVKELKKTARSGTARELGKALDALPGNLIEFYDRILKGLDMSSSSNESQRMLEWVVFAETPLSVADLRYAVFIGSELRPSDLGSMEDPETTVPMELMEARIHEYSGGLLEVKIQVRESDRTEQIGYWDTEYSGRDEDRFVQLIHQSVKDFLLQKRSPRPISAAQPLLLFDPHKAHTHLARVCLRFLGFPEFDTASRLPTLPFLKYSTTYWVTHAELADIRQEEAQMLEFGWPRRKNFSAWATSPMMNDWVNITRWRSDPLSLASAVGLWADARYFLALLNQELDTWEKNNTLSVALVAAASGGHERIVQLLLDSGADANCRALFSESALQEAASRGYETIVQILLDAGANVLYADRSGDALTAAADGGNEKIVQLLLDAGADANAQGGEYGTALQAAAYRGNEKIVHLLLGAGADVHAQSGEYETALHEAAHNGNEKVVKILLDAGADVDIQDRQYGTALQAAAYTDKVGVLQLLLDAGADVNSQAGGGPATALHIAIAAGNKNVVQFLINAGADIDTIDVQSGTALQVAAYWDNPGILQLLLDAGANIDAEGGEHGTALQAAAYTGNENIVQLLLDKGANVNSQGGSYESPLKAAAYSGNEKVLQLLLDTGADPNSQDRECRTALHVAACGEREKVVQVLLDAGADANAQDRQYGTALQAAAHHGNEKIVQLLLGAGADVNAGVGQYGTALQLAVRYGNERVIQILLEAGADPNAQDWGWGTALEIAIDTGLVNSVQQLLDSGADVGTRSRETVSQETRDIHEPFSGADSGASSWEAPVFT